MVSLHEKVENSLTMHGIVYEAVGCDPQLADTQDFCRHYGYGLEQAANAILCAGKSEPILFACCLVLATTKLDVNRQVTKLMAVRKASFAGSEETKHLTGMMIGGVTPFGLPQTVPIYVDGEVMLQERIIIGGGNRSSKVILAPSELLKLPNLTVVDGLAKPR